MTGDAHPIQTSIDQNDAPLAEPGLARSAGLLSLGSAAGRILGLLREVAIASYFGASGQVSAFRIASQVPVLIYDFLVGGMLSAALVPVLSQYARRSRRSNLHTEFRTLVGSLLTLFALALALLVLVIEVFASQLAWLLAGGFLTTSPDLLPLTIRLIRLVAPAVWLFSVAGLLTAILYSLQRFSFPAAATAVYNLGIVVAAPLLAHRLGIASLVVGILAGCLAQVALLAFDLRRAGVRLRFAWNLKHPGLARVVLLYLPIAGGLVVSLFQIGLDRRLASGTGEQSIAWMANATTLQQMPLGLISVAVAQAALPALSRAFAAGDEDDYRRTLARALRLVLLLILPAAAALWILGEPLARLLFERNLFTPADTHQVTLALSIYVVGMIFAAVDFPLNFAFYARNNTLLPALVGVGSVLVYIAAAYLLLGAFGYLGLVWADSAKQAAHALVMALLLWQRIGLRDAQLRTFAVIALATLLMAGIMALLAAWIARLILPGPTQDIAMLLVAGGSGLLAYGLVTTWFGVDELNVLARNVAARFRRPTP